VGQVTEVQAAAVWEKYISLMEEDERLGELKSCIDDINCIDREKSKTEEDVNKLIRESYTHINLVDVKAAIRKKPESASEDEKSWTNLVRRTLQVSGERRKRGRLVRPKNRYWDIWREAQKKRYCEEDQSQRGKEISYIPFAMELTVGCSGGCEFCGFSAGKLKEQETTYKQQEGLYTEILEHMKELAGKEYGQYGILYWATDPMDQKEYEKYALKFKEVMGTLPCTTTALAEQKIDNLKRLIKLYKTNQKDKYWKLRVSISSEKAYRLLKSELTRNEQAIIEINPQYGWLKQTFAKAGRSYKGESIEEQQKHGGTIACVTGFEISLPLRRIRLITPCLADEVNKNGYRIITEETFNTAEEFKGKINNMIKKISKPSLELNDYIKLNIARSHYQIYRDDVAQSILETISPKGVKIKDVIAGCKNMSTQAIVIQLARLIQDGSIKHQKRDRADQHQHETLCTDPPGK
jgi:uncharacterized protein YaaR (DUF327 family)